MTFSRRTLLLGGIGAAGLVLAGCGLPGGHDSTYWRSQAQLRWVGSQL